MSKSSREAAESAESAILRMAWAEHMNTFEEGKDERDSDFISGSALL